MDRITRTKLEMKTGALHVNISDFDGSAHAGFHASRRESEIDLHVYPKRPDEFLGMREEYFTLQVSSEQDSSVAIYLNRKQLEEIVDKARDLLNETSEICRHADEREDHVIGA